MLKDFMTNVNVDFQLVPPSMHCQNAAECAIHMFKNHFIAGLCSVDKDFPLHLWDCLLPQALLTLNLLCSSWINPKLSAWAQIHGTYDFNCTPLAQPGIHVLVHKKPDKCTTWSLHALNGWYTGPALQSYQCYMIWVWDTCAERICNTVSWFPTKVMMLLALSNDLILVGIHNIVAALNNPSPGSPLASLTESHVNALKQLTNILTGIATNPAPGSASTNPTITMPAPAPPTLTSHKPDDPPAQAENTNDPSLRVGTWATPIDTNEPTTPYQNSTGPTGHHRHHKTCQKNKQKSAPTTRPSTPLQEHHHPTCMPHVPTPNSITLLQQLGKHWLPVKASHSMPTRHFTAMHLTPTLGWLLSITSWACAVRANSGLMLVPMKYAASAKDTALTCWMALIPCFLSQFQPTHSRIRWDTHGHFVVKSLIFI